MISNTELKSLVHAAVESKRSATQARLAYKRSDEWKERGVMGTMQLFWSACRVAKDRARHIHLAACFMRRTPYWRCERQVADGNMPHAAQIADILGSRHEYTVAVEEWLAASPTEEQRAAYEAHLERVRLLAREAKISRHVSRSQQVRLRTGFAPSPASSGAA